MSDLTGGTDPLPGSADPAAPPVDGDPVAPQPTPVPASMEELVALLGPAFEGAIAIAVEQAVKTTPVPTLKPGRVQGYSVTTGAAAVLMDDAIDSGVTVQIPVVCERPMVGDQVVVLFDSTGQAMVVGSITAPGGLPAGVLVSYAGILTTDTPTPAGGTGPPHGFYWPHGQAFSSSEDPALYAAIGNTYGGSAIAPVLPDLRGRMFVGMDNMGGADAGLLSSANTLGATGGSETHSGIPAHTHSIDHDHPGGTTSNAGGSHTHDLAGHTHNVNPHNHGTGSYAVANHNHGTGSYAVGSHNHTLGGASVGSHTHSITGVGDHSHTTVNSNNLDASGGHYVDGGTGFAWQYSAGGSPTTTAAGGHDHGGNTGSASPGLSGNTDGTSPSFTGNSGDSAPGLSGNSGDSSPGTGGPSINTSGSTNIDHSHSFDVAFFGGTSGSTGGGAVNHMPPFITGHWLIKR